MDKRKILIQLDSDPQPSVFDRVVAIDAGVDEVFSYGGVKPEQVRDLVHGAIFTRGPKDLKRTAIFIGGSDVAAGEQLLAEVRRHMLPQFGLRVSVLLDANGANTTAAAAVRAAARHLDLKRRRPLVLGGTGPVGQRVARLLAGQGAEVAARLAAAARARSVSRPSERKLPGAQVEPAGIAHARGTASRPGGPDAGRRRRGRRGRAAARGRFARRVQACGWPSTSTPCRRWASRASRSATRRSERDGVVCYGALGVGDTKMKIHKAAIARLFESNDQVLDAEEVYALAQNSETQVKEPPHLSARPACDFDSDLSLAAACLARSDDFQQAADAGPAARPGGTRRRETRRQGAWRSAVRSRRTWTPRTGSTATARPAPPPAPTQCGRPLRSSARPVPGTTPRRARNRLRRRSSATT